MELTLQIKMEILDLLVCYGFDLEQKTPEELIERWRKEVPISWVRLAVIEALYLGRYKAVSVEQILKLWSRLASPNLHFTHEFERVICRKFPKYLSSESEIEIGNYTIEANNPQIVEGELDASPARLEIPVKKSALGTNKFPKRDRIGNSIDRFIPLEDPSELYFKLMAVARQR
jgi:hypothetical protein